MPNNSASVQQTTPHIREGLRKHLYLIFKQLVPDRTAALADIAGEGFEPSIPVSRTSVLPITPSRKREGECLMSQVQSRSTLSSSMT
ncbi:MAG: hypothetical protein QOJ64_494 [Acidobacteriota bacterium]|nr:hypothetical protein [Acidobacteriota bacterium]